MLEALSPAVLGLALLAGSLTTLSPCVFPVLPLVVGGAVQQNRLAPVAMGVGMALSFALIGVLLGALGPALGIDGDHVRTFGGWLLLAFGLVMLVPALNARFTEWMLPIAQSTRAARRFSSSFQQRGLRAQFQYLQSRPRIYLLANQRLA